MAHLDRDFPQRIAAGCQATIERRSTVVFLASGREERNAHWKHSRRSWAAGLAIQSADDLAEVLDLFEEANGRLHSFRFQDWQDYSSAAPSAVPSPLDQEIGTGDGTAATFQLVKSYGRATRYLREITLPRLPSLRLAVDGVEVISGWSASLIGGLVTFDTPPDFGAVVTAGFRFDVPVRFDADQMISEWAYFSDAGGVTSAPDVPLIEVRL